MTRMDALLRDVRIGLRRVVSAPGFAAVAIFTLALGIGANVAIFTVVNAVLLRPLPFPEPDRLVRISADARATGGRNIGISEPELASLRSSHKESRTAKWPRHSLSPIGQSRGTSRGSSESSASVTAWSSQAHSRHVKHRGRWCQTQVRRPFRLTPPFRSLETRGRRHPRAREKER